MHCHYSSTCRERLNDYDIFIFKLITTITFTINYYKKNAQLSQRDCAGGCIIVLAKSGRLELGDNILQTL